MGRAARFLFAFGAWTVIGLFFSTQLYLIRTHLDRQPPSWEYALLGALPQWYIWGLLSPLVFWLARKFPFDKRPLSVVVHIVAGLSLAALQVVGYSAFCQAMGWSFMGSKTLESKIIFLFVVQYHWAFLTYAVMVAAVLARDYYLKYQEREALLAKAQLQALKSQLHPHFLFNSLHATLALVRRDPAAAERMIVRLGDLLRATLESSVQHEVPLKQEIRFTEQYLEIERTRFLDRLSVDFVVDAATLELQVPNMILQPLVENAVKHGISPRSAPGHILVRAARDNGRLLLEVTDDGVGLPAGPVREGIGLSNTRARLRQLYGEHQKLELVTPTGGGLSARLEIPAR